MSTPEQEPRRWTLRASRRPSNMVDDDWNVVGPGPKMFGLTDNSFQGEQVRVMPVEEGEAWRDRALKAEDDLLLCKRGHPFEGENLYVTPVGQRKCRACRREAVRRYSARKAAQA